MNSKLKLKIALIAPPLSGHKYRGTGTYTKELYQALLKIREIEVKLIDIKDTINDFDLIHFPYFDPFFLTLPLIKKKPAVVTVHDLIPMKFPQYFKRGIKGELKWNIQKISLKGAKAVITDSIASKDDIVKYAGIDPNNIRVIYLGADENFKIINDKTTLDSVRRKYGLTGDFILHVGDVNYNKNVDGLIKAFYGVTRRNESLRLVLVGSGFVHPSPPLNELTELMEKLNLENRVIRIGHIPKADLTGIYNLASIYVQISRAEGFGLPVLEAMACGCPVIASNASSLPELVDDAAILVNPYDEKDISKGILNILNNSIKKKELIDKGLQRVKKFNWEKAAFETIKIYQKILNND